MIANTIMTIMTAIIIVILIIIIITQAELSLTPAVAESAPFLQLLSWPVASHDDNNNNNSNNNDNDNNDNNDNDIIQC